MHALLRAAVPDLRRSLEAAGRVVTWEVFRRLDVDSTPDHRPMYAALAADLGIPEQQVKSHADFARKAMREVVLARIRKYADREADVVQKLRELFR